MVNAFAADKLNGAPYLVGDDPPPVDFFLVDPTRTVKGRDECRLEGVNLERSRASHHRPFCQARQREVQGGFKGEASLPAAVRLVDGPRPPKGPDTK
jgi:hypothetical protein